MISPTDQDAVAGETWVRLGDLLPGIVAAIAERIAEPEAEAAE